MIEKDTVGVTNFVWMLRCYGVVIDSKLSGLLLVQWGDSGCTRHKHQILVMLTWFNCPVLVLISAGAQTQLLVQ